MRNDWPYPMFSKYQKHLRENAGEYFKRKRFAVSKKYNFILASRDDWHQNIILPEVVQYIEEQKQFAQSQKRAYPLHRYIHHGLSSQAMVFNLLGPLVVRNHLSPLVNLLQKRGVEIDSGKVNGVFEYEDREVFLENQAQPTSIDFALLSHAGNPIALVESKLVEQRFGGCSVLERGDCDGRNPAKDHSLCYLHEIGRRYWEVLEKHGFLIGKMKDSPTCVLGTFYQYFREVLFALEKGTPFILLIDERNPAFSVLHGERERGFIPFLETLLPATAKPRVSTVSIQEIVRSIEKHRAHKDWIYEFADKYGVK